MIDARFLKQHRELKQAIDRDIHILSGYKNRKILLAELINRPGMDDTIRVMDQETAELQRRIETAQRKFKKERAEIEKQISEIDDSRVRLFLTLRYIDMLTWPMVSAVTDGGYTTEAVKKICMRYLEKHDTGNK